MFHDIGSVEKRSHEMQVLLLPARHPQVVPRPCGPFELWPASFSVRPEPLKYAEIALWLDWVA